MVAQSHQEVGVSVCPTLGNVSFRYFVQTVSFRLLDDKGGFPKYLCNEQIFHEEILSFSDLTASDDACLKPNIIVCVHAKLLQSCLTPGDPMGCSCCWARAFSSCNEWVLLSSCGTQASHCGGFSCAEHAPWGLGSEVMAHRLGRPWHVESPQVRDQTRVPCMGRRILHH